MKPKKIKYKLLPVLKRRKIEKLFKYFTEVLDVDLLDKTQTRNLFEYRSLFNTLLTNKYKLRLCNIVHFYEYKNCYFNHASIIHSLKKFDYYCIDSPELKELYFDLHDYERKKEDIKQTIINIDKRNLTPIQKLVGNLTPSQEAELIELIELRKKSWEWKNKDTTKTYIGS